MLDDDFITEQLALGYTLPELAEMWHLSYTILNNNYSYTKMKFNYLDDKLKITGKTEAYYSNEWDYGNTPTYKFKELSKVEIEFYNEYLKINN